MFFKSFSKAVLAPAALVLGFFAVTIVSASAADFNGGGVLNVQVSLVQKQTADSAALALSATQNASATALSANLGNSVTDPVDQSITGATDATNATLAINGQLAVVRDQAAGAIAISLASGSSTASATALNVGNIASNSVTQVIK